MANMTYVEAIEVAISVLAHATEPNGVVDESNATVIEKLEALKAQLTKRSISHKPTKTQKENEVLKEDIWAWVSENGAKRAMNVGTYFGITGQKASALLKQLVDAGRLEKYTEKGVTYFRVAEGV